jgi:Holliday junction DNA helicase RuvA
MIGYLRGQIKIYSDHLLVISGGVGYKVFVGDDLLRLTPESEQEFFIHSYIKEDRFELYGFPDAKVLQLFELLLSVSGCGPKTALLIVSEDAHAFITAIQEANVSYFTHFPRVGKKLAQKLIIELKNKLGSVKDLDLTPKSQAYSDVFAALVTLGFSENQVSGVLTDLNLEILSTSDAITQALKKLKA